MLRVDPLGVSDRNSGYGVVGGNIHDGNGIVIEDRGHIFRGEFVCRVTDQKTRLSDGTVTDDHTPVQ